MAIFYFDENFSYHIAAGLNEFEKIDDLHQVKSTELEFGKGITDDELIPLIANSNRGILVTRDKKLVKVRAQRQILIDNQISCFLVNTSGLNHWGQIRLLMKKWLEMKEFATQNRRKHFVAQVKSNSKIEQL